MDKMKLQLDQLAVESFSVEDENGGRGTIRGNQEDAYAAITGISWLCGSCEKTCNGADDTCAISCRENYTQCNSRYCQDKLLSELKQCEVDAGSVEIKG